MSLPISPTMPLDKLAERMSNDTVPASVVAAMRALLVERAPAHGWETTDDVGEAEWLRLLATAIDIPGAEGVVMDAIFESLMRNSIVTLNDKPGLRDALSVVCDDNAKNDGVHEYWGTDDEGCTWRVHVRLKVGA